jgi:hypothetical protein
MMLNLRAVAAASALLIALLSSSRGFAQKIGRHPENVQRRQPGEHVDP